MEHGLYLQGDVTVLVGRRVVSEKRPVKIIASHEIETIFSERRRGIPEPIASRIVGQRVKVEIDGELYATTTRFILKKQKSGAVSLRLVKKYTRLEWEVVRLKTPGGMTVKMRRPTVTALTHKGQQGGGYAFCGVGKRRRS